MSGLWTIFLVNVGVVVAIALCARGLIPVNSMIGMRTRAVMASDEAWKAGHRAALPPMVVSLILSAGFVTLVETSIWAVDDSRSTLVVVALMLVGVIAGGILATLTARKIPSDSSAPYN